MTRGSRKLRLPKPTRPGCSCVPKSTWEEEGARSRSTPMETVPTFFTTESQSISEGTLFQLIDDSFWFLPTIPKNLPFWFLPTIPKNYKPKPGKPDNFPLKVFSFQPSYFNRSDKRPGPEESGQSHLHLRLRRDRGRDSV